MKRIALVLIALCCAAPPLTAQRPASLDRAETLAGDGRYGEARIMLTQWWSEHKTPRSSESPLVARALMLRARLTMHPDTAEKDYLRIVLEHPSSPQTPEALLRLGQHFIAQGNVERGRVYLRRLASDYPGTSQRATALAFLARADSAKPAVRARAVAVDETVKPTPRAVLPAPRPNAEPAPKRNAEPAPKRNAEPAPKRNAEPAPVRANTTGAYALQSGAFRLEAGATSLAARLRKAGYDARIVGIRGELKLVRIGRYATAKEAVNVAKQVRAQGFAAVVVDDVIREKPIR